MKYLTILLAFLPVAIFAQGYQNFEIELESTIVDDAPGVHSFSVGIDTLGRWLILGGRVDGLHQRQPFAAFLASDNNTKIFVIDIDKGLVWSSELNTLSSLISEQLQSTNQEFFQRNNDLYVIGGYGYSQTVGDHITYPYLTAVDVNGATNAIINDNDITPFFRQIPDSRLAVTGGYLGYLDSVFYLAGGQYFEGRYNPMGPNHGPGFIQEYTDAIRTFKIEDDGYDLTIAEFSEMVDSDHLHRRDYNMAPQIFPNGEHGFTMFSGVFQHDVDLPFLNSVNITPSGYEVNNDFNQYLSQYHSAHIPIYDEANNTMHTLFFGGLSQFTLDANGNLVEDINVPFVKTISCVTRLNNGDMEEVKLGIEMPVLVGSGAEFISHSEAPFISGEILDLDQVSEQKTLIGYIYGGIQSTEENIFFFNNGTQSFANNIVFKVFIRKIITTSSNDPNLDFENVFNIKLYPNPVDSQLVIEYFNPDPERINIELIDVHGKRITTIFQGLVQQGVQKQLFRLPDLPEGIYFISIDNSQSKNVKSIFLE